MLNQIERLEGLGRWLKRDDWPEVYAEHRSLCVLDACERVGIPPAELSSILGPHYGGAVDAWVFLDFLATALPDGANVVDLYLEKRGWKEDGATRILLREIRRSVPSAYEILEVQPGGRARLGDLLRPGDPIEVTGGIKPQLAGASCAARLITVSGQRQFAGVPLYLDKDHRDAFLASLRDALEKADLPADPASERIGITGVDARLRALGPLFSSLWVVTYAPEMAERAAREQAATGTPQSPAS